MRMELLRTRLIESSGSWQGLEIAAQAFGASTAKRRLIQLQKERQQLNSGCFDASPVAYVLLFTICKRVVGRPITSAIYGSALIEYCPVLPNVTL